MKIKNNDLNNGFAKQKSPWFITLVLIASIGLCSCGNQSAEAEAGPKNVSQLTVSEDIESGSQAVVDSDSDAPSNAGTDSDAVVDSGSGAGSNDVAGFGSGAGSDDIAGFGSGTGSDDVAGFGSGTGSDDVAGFGSGTGSDTMTDYPPEDNLRPEVTIRMVGDVLLHTPVENSVKQEDGSYDYDVLFSQTKGIISDADLALVNQEVIIGGAELGISGYPCFNADFSLCDTLSEVGFDVVCHATNHALDKGKKGLVSCAENWENRFPEMAVLGIHDTPETSMSQGAQPYIYECGELRIAILNYTYGTNGIALPEDMPYAVDLLVKEQVIADIKLAEELADFTIVCPHWGTEYRLSPDASQSKWVKIFAENGVDLVLGTHPHVIEPIEWVTDEETGHEMLVYYSLGNYVNWTSGTGQGVANRMVGGMADVTITLDEEGNAVIGDYGVLALVSHVQSGPEGVTTYFLSDYTKELESQNEIVFQDSNFSLDYCKDLCDSVWGDLWK